MLVAASLIIGVVVSTWQAVRATRAESQANANEAQARLAAEAASAAKNAESAQRQRAEAGERRVEQHLESAFEAIDRLLARIENSDLQHIPRAREVQRSMAQDAIDFLERSPLGPDDPPAVRYRAALTWSRLGELGRTILEAEPSQKAHDAAMSLIQQLVAEYPANFEYGVSLAEIKQRTTYHYAISNDFEKSEQIKREVAQLYAMLAERAPSPEQRLLMLQKQVGTLVIRGLRLKDMRKFEESLACVEEAIQIANQVDFTLTSAHSLRAELLEGLGRISPEERDGTIREAIARNREFAGTNGRRKSSHDPWLADALWDLGQRLRERSPVEADACLVEALEIYRNVLRDSPITTPRHRRRHVEIIHANVMRLRDRALSPAANHDPVKAALQLEQADALSQEAIHLQRQLVSEFPWTGSAVAGDPWGVPQEYVLAIILQKEAEYLLGRVGTPTIPQKNDDDAKRLQADALLTEAIQVFRQVTAESPDDAKYRNRLAALLRLQAQHFGEKDGGRAPEPLRSGVP